MTEHNRYAIYYLAPEGSELARFGAEWLGWDVDQAVPCESPAPDLTATPRKYGFHGTLKPPFRLADGKNFDQLEDAVDALGRRSAPVVLDGLELSQLGKFFALTPRGDTTALSALAASCVRDLDGFRAPASNAELQKRRAKRLSPAQEAHLTQWGYPYVMDQFRFHLTLTGAVAKDRQADVHAKILAALPQLPAPFEITEIGLAGERSDGAFEMIKRIPLSARSSN